MAAPYKLYAAEFSLYSGKARSYLRKKGLAFKEITPSVWVYQRFIVPRTGVRYIPVVQTPDDQVLQDTTVIIDELEQRHPESSVYPATPRQYLISLLLEVYGDEWLLIPAMHYRWYYREQNYRFVIGEFGRMLLPGWPGLLQRWLGKRIGHRFAAAVPMLGVTEHNRLAIEASYEQLLADLNRHFSEHDFLLGGAPSIGDFGLIAPFYAHLYRDPYSGEQMRERAPAVAAWVQRMMSPEVSAGKFLADDAIPSTLLPVLRRMAAEQLPVLQDTDHRLAAWRESHPQTSIPRMIGWHDFQVEGVAGQRVILPYSAWLYQRPLDAWHQLTTEQQQSVDQVLRPLGFGDALQRRPLAPMVRRHNRLEFADQSNTV
ncbi:MAG: hypothetical protein Tsb002_12790 [Wenzhouxiangellaceae bacterium]